jgi:hypothetical protein
MNANFKKIVAFKGTIREFLNMVAVHIEDSRHLPISLFETFFRVSVSLNSLILNWIMYPTGIVKRQCNK